MKDYFFLAFNNLKRRKLRSWLTMIGIFIGIAAVVALISLGQGMQNYINEGFEKLGKDKIIGLSVETIKQAKQANNSDVDYIGLSPVFSTNTKLDINTPLGLSGVKEIASFTKHKTVAIGGINSTNAKELIASGADGIAVVSAIVSHENPQKAASELREIIKHAK